MNEPIELLAPAGNLEKLKMAIWFGANAVYLAGHQFGLRSGAGNFTLDEMREGVAFAHENGAKAYLAMNIFARNEDIRLVPDYVKQCIETGIDAVIVSDAGMFSAVRKVSNIPIHLSTQASTTNAAAARFWYEQGVSRIILARELSLGEIAEIRAECPPALELEAFVHGAMCMAISGRCLLSNHMTGRDANRGDCAQPCRWKYHVVESKRPHDAMPIETDERGTYLFNSKDLNMLAHIPEILAAGITSLKIEGRMKSAFYAATVTRAYRAALDAAVFSQEANPHVATSTRTDFDLKAYERELRMVSNRTFTTGFFFTQPKEEEQNADWGGYHSESDFVALYMEMSEDNTMAKLEQRNNFKVGDMLEFVSPHEPIFSITVTEMTDDEGTPIQVAPHAQMIVWLRTDRTIPAHAFIRRPKIQTNS
jgi:U32 family peptidase